MRWTWRRRRIDCLSPSCGNREWVTVSGGDSVNDPLRVRRSRLRRRYLHDLGGAGSHRSHSSALGDRSPAQTARRRSMADSRTNGSFRGRRDRRGARGHMISRTPRRRVDEPPRGRSTLANRQRQGLAGAAGASVDLAERRAAVRARLAPIRRRAAEDPVELEHQHRRLEYRGTSVLPG
jgi:hypothetical protein